MDTQSVSQNPFRVLLATVSWALNLKFPYNPAFEGFESQRECCAK
jgi:hypothetical protein